MTSREVARRRAQEHNADTPLLKLPGEIRNQIYDLCLEPKYSTSPFPKAQDSEDPRRPDVRCPIIPSLARVCTQIRSEFQPLYWRDTEIDIRLNHLGKFLQDFSEQNTRYAHQVIDWEWDYYCDRDHFGLWCGNSSPANVVPRCSFMKVTLSDPSPVLEPVVPDPDFQIYRPGPYYDIFSSEDLARFPQVLPIWKKYLEDVAALLVELVAQRFNKRIHVWFTDVQIRGFIVRCRAFRNEIAGAKPPIPTWDPTRFLPLVREYVEEVL